ncbi:MAG: hypothetical protein IPP35_08665 [Elusimicrobia bacterium]|nr:hypothetical protein [Elusimicrobiota bacterium]
MLRKLARFMFRLLLKASGQGPYGVRIYEYKKADGSFDYDTYRKVQIKGNKEKIKNVWVVEEDIAHLSDFIRKIIGDVHFGLCHGTRRGKEQEWFSKYLGCKVLGTELSDTATQFPNTIQWDFHDVKPEWMDKVDFIYSNAFDHSYDPEKCLSAWMSCVRKNGVCIIEHSSEHIPGSVTKLDPFGAELILMPFLITSWGKGKYCVREILQAPSTQINKQSRTHIVIQRL